MKPVQTCVPRHEVQGVAPERCSKARLVIGAWSQVYTYRSVKTSVFEEVGGAKRKCGGGHVISFFPID